LESREKNFDHKHQLKNQIMESKSHKHFNATTNKNIYLELTSLEEQQILLEKKMQEEKKSYKMKFMQKTISENKLKIEEKKVEIVKQKQLEKEEQKVLSDLIVTDAEKIKMDAQEKKYMMKRAMSKQFEEIAKKKTDLHELDRLAQAQADKINDKFDDVQVRKHVIRQDLIKQAVLGNDDQLIYKQWKNSMNVRAGQKDYKASLDQARLAEKEAKEEVLEDKQKKRTMKGALLSQLQKQNEVAESAGKSNLQLEKDLLKNASEYDG